MVERWMAFNKVDIPDLQYKDRVYLPVVRFESKLLFQHFKNKTKPQQCRAGLVTMDWSSNETFIDSMKLAISYLAAQKDEYEVRRRGRRGRERMDEEFTDDEVATAEDEDEDTDDIDDDAKRSLEPKSKGKSEDDQEDDVEEDEVEEDDTDDLSGEESENEEEETVDDSESENADFDRNRNRKRKNQGKRKGAAKRQGKDKAKGAARGVEERGRSGKGTVRSFPTMVAAAEWDYNPDHVPAQPTKKRSWYTPMNEDADDSDTEVHIHEYVHYPFSLFLLTVNKNDH